MFKIPLAVLREKIVGSGKLTAPQLEQRVKDKINELSGLVSEEGAMNIIANELGIELLPPQREKLKVKEIYPGMRNVSLLGKVVQKYETRTFAKGDKKGKVVEAKAIEVGNIFPLGTMYAEKMNMKVTDQKGKRIPVWFASYGIGPTRLLGTYAEVFHDEKGLLWPKVVAPFACHLLSLSNLSNLTNLANSVYEKLEKAGIEVLYDDREDKSAGEKFADADLIGCPWRLVVSEKTAGKIELKKRFGKDAKLVSIAELLDLLI